MIKLVAVLLALFFVIVAPALSQGAPSTPAPAVTVAETSYFAYPDADGWVAVVPGVPGDYLGIDADGIARVRFAWGMTATGVVFSTGNQDDPLIVGVDLAAIVTMPETACTAPAPQSPASTQNQPSRRLLDGGDGWRR